MMAQFRKYADFASSTSAVLAVLISCFLGTSHFFENMRFGEGVIASFTLAVSAIAGAASLYIARVTKKISNQQRIFISYSLENKPAARELRNILIDKGAVVWFDENDFQPGDDMHASINSAIENSNTVIALLSNKFGDHISMELKSALDNRVNVFAVMDSNGKEPDILKNYRKAFFYNKKEDLNKLASMALDVR